MSDLIHSPNMNEATMFLPDPAPPPINLTDDQTTILERLVCNQTNSQRLIRRANAILTTAAEKHNQYVAA